MCLAVFQGKAQTNGYPPAIRSYGNQNNRSRSDSAQHLPHKYALTQNTTDSTPQIFVWTTPSGDSLVVFVNGRYIVYTPGSGGGDTANLSFRQDTLATSIDEKMDTLWTITDSTFGYYKNGVFSSYKMRGLVNGPGYGFKIVSGKGIVDSSAFVAWTRLYKLNDSMKLINDARYLQTGGNGITDSAKYAILGGSVYKNTTIDLSAYNKKLWIKLTTKTTSDTSTTSQMIVGNTDTGSYKIPEFRNSALLISKSQTTNNGNVDWLAMTAADAVGPNGIFFRGFSQSNGLTQPQMAIYNADPTNNNGNPAFAITAHRKFTGLGNNFGYTLNLENIDSVLAGASNTAIRGSNIFVIDNGQENAFFIDSNYNVKIGPTGFFNYPRARLDIHNNGKAWGIYQEGITSKNMLESKLIVGGTFPGTDTLNKFTVIGTAKITDTLTNITLGNSDSSNRVPSTAWVKRQGYGSSSGSTSASPQTQIMGLVYSLNPASTLSDFVDSSSNATVSGRTISFGAGDNNLFQKSLDLHDPITSTKWIAIDTEIVATVTSTSWGRGLGLRSVNRIGGGAFGFAMNVDLSSGVHAGQLGFWSLGGSGLVNLTYTANAMAFTAGDTVIRILRRDMLTFYGTIYNKTQRTLPITASYTFASSDVSKTAPNVGRPCIYNLGDAGSVIGWSFVNNETKGAPLAIISDSRAFYYPSTNSSRWPVILDNYFHPTAVFAGPGDRATEAIAAFNEVLAARPVNTLIMFSTNDFNSGQNVTTVMNNYRTMIAALRGVGSNPFIMCPPYQGVNTGKQDSVRKLNDSIIANLPDSIVIRGAYEAIRQNPGYYLQPDSVHFLDPGDSLMPALILASGKIKTGYTTPYVIPDNGYVKAQTTVAQPVSYLISGVGTAGGFSTTSQTYTGTSGLAAQFTANGSVKAFSNGSTSIGIYSAPIFIDNGKSPVAHYSGYFALATLRCDSNFLLNGQLSSTRPITTTSSTASTLGNTALSYLTLGSLTAASGNGSLIRSTSTIAAAANNDYLIGNMSAPTFTVGAFTGVKQFAYYGNAGNQYFNNHTMLGSSDADNGTDVLQVTGTGKFTSQLKLAASTTSLASLNIPHGSAPTSPVNGDFWTTTSGAFAQINGSTVSLGGGASTPFSVLQKYSTNLGSTYDARTFVDKNYVDSIVAAAVGTSGSYTPTITGTGNVSSSSPQVCYYMRMGNVVVVWGYAIITATAGSSTATTFEVSLPIASNLNVTGDVTGEVTDASNTGNSGFCGPNITAEAAIVNYKALGTGITNIQFRFTYPVKP